MSNPVFNDRRIATATADHPGWAAPATLERSGMTPVVAKSTSMTVSGTMSASAVLLVLLVIAASVGWFGVEAAPDGTVQMPPFTVVAMLAGFGAAILAVFKPGWARFLGPVYALCYGYAVGAISRLFEIQYDGIVLQAVGATVGVAAVMLTLYRTRIVKVTERFRRIVIVSTLGVAVFYLVSFVMSLFGASPSFLTSPSLFGIGFSVVVAGLAAANLMLDFDNIDRGVAAGLPKSYEWMAALGLVVTLVWLYLELLRLFSKLRS